MRIHLVGMFLAFPILTLLGGCGDDSVTQPDSIVFPSKNVSYSQHVQPFFNLGCATYGCHDDVNRAGQLSLTSYQRLFDRPGIVIRGNSASSVLMQKIDGRLPHSFTVPILINENQINGIKTWIDEGAQFN